MSKERKVVYIRIDKERGLKLCNCWPSLWGFVFSPLKLKQRKRVRVLG